MHKINYGGVEIADSEYRIGIKLYEDNIDRKEALDTHLRCAFEEYGGFMDPKGLL